MRLFNKRKTPIPPVYPWGATGGAWWEDPRPPDFSRRSSPAPAEDSGRSDRDTAFRVVIPGGSGVRYVSARAIRRALRGRRRVRREKLRSLKRRIVLAKETLIALERAGYDPNPPGSDLAQRWREWDDEEGERVREDLLDDLAVLYPDASDVRLQEIAAGFVRSKP